MTKEVKMNEVMDAVEDLRDVAKEAGINSPEFKALEEKTNGILEAQEKQSQAAVTAQAQAEKKSLELEEKVDALEVELARSYKSGDASYKESAEYKALNAFAKGGNEALDSEQKALLRTDNDTAGGYLTNVEMDNAIIRAITEISGVRAVSRVRTVGRKSIEMPVRRGIPTATYEGEAQAAKQSTSNYGSETVTCSRLTAEIPFTYDMMIDSGFDIESEITADVSESMAQAEGANFVKGDGVKKPEGFLNHADITGGASVTGAAGVISGDDLIKLTGELKTGYDPMFAFNRRTLAQLRTLKGVSNDHYLWQAGIGEDVPNTLLGERYVVMEDMPDIAAGAIPVMYADFMRGYTIIDRSGTAVIRDNLTEASNNIIKLIFHRYNTGQVTLSEAFKGLKVA